MDLRLAPGRWMGSAAASGSGNGEDCGEDLLSNCGWEGGGGVAAIIQHERGSFQHLLSLSHHALLCQDLLVR